MSTLTDSKESTGVGSTLHDRVFNKYGEVVALHGPVCGICHQRIAQPFSNPTSKENVCIHCYSGHTPGPWRVRTSDGSSLLIAEFFPITDRTENARLIAAAPEMLEALEAAGFYLNLIKPIELGGEGLKAWETRTKVEAAIAKAKGGR